MNRYHQLLGLIDQVKPRTIVEVGTHRGARAVMMCRYAITHRNHVHYIGYDLFEDATPETNAAEMNGKGKGSMAMAQRGLDMIDGLSYELIKGNTRDTLHGKDVVADFVFIDGGHSVETIRGDYEALKGSTCVVFDDYYTAGVDTMRFGCNQVLKSVPFQTLPVEDRFGDVGVKMAVMLAVRAA